MPVRQRLLEQWNSYRIAVITGPATVAQLTDMRRAFYAGAAAFQTEVLRGLTPGPDEREADLLMLAELNDELLEFKRKVKEGQA
jgi:hypothetical protein